ncbi:hypothetical protein QAD02_011760 [Eretmocerus hayati]|uniref:Uncharacterized protein n=1 Tax=Eretmocerus hayati TaxID=131215 RepID=A0ACC2NY17_9HYME|nr:hypothetical protein QAD02_011760 [Eretmocerus hayati]
MREKKEAQSESNDNIPPPGPFKRPLPTESSLSEKSAERVDQEKKNNKVNTQSKKAKTTAKQPLDPVKVAEQLKDAKQLIEDNKDKYPLNNDQLVKFICDAQASNDVINTASDLTDNLQSIEEMLSDIYPLLKSRPMKSRFTKLKNRLFGAANVESTTGDELTQSENENEFPK